MMRKDFAGKAEAAEACRPHTSEAIASLLRVLRSDNMQAVCTAAGLLLAYAWGRPAQQMDIRKTTIDLSDSQTIDALYELRRKMGLPYIDLEPIKPVEPQPATSQAKPEASIREGVEVLTLDPEESQNMAIRISPRRGLP